MYAYAREDLDEWQAELGVRLRNGVFGENLTTECVAVNDALVGERWRIGDEVLLEVCCPRIPCGTFQGWLGRAGWIRRFTEAARPGAYLRVIAPGPIGGDPVVIEHRPDHDVTVAVTFRATTIEPNCSQAAGRRRAPRGDQEPGPQAHRRITARSAERWPRRA